MRFLVILTSIKRNYTHYAQIYASHIVVYNESRFVQYAIPHPVKNVIFADF